MTRHSYLRDGVTKLPVKAFTHSYVHDDPLIRPGHAVREGKSQPKGSLLNNQPADK